MLEIWGQAVKIPDQWLSFAGGCVIVTGNIVWIIQVVYYLYGNHRVK